MAGQNWNKMVGQRQKTNTYFIIDKVQNGTSLILVKMPFSVCQCLCLTIIFSPHRWTSHPKSHFVHYSQFMKYKKWIKPNGILWQPNLGLRAQYLAALLQINSRVILIRQWLQEYKCKLLAVLVKLDFTYFGLLPLLFQASSLHLVYGEPRAGWTPGRHASDASSLIHFLWWSIFSEYRRLKIRSLLRPGPLCVFLGTGTVARYKQKDNTLPLTLRMKAGGQEQSKQ